MVVVGKSKIVSLRSSRQFSVATALLPNVPSAERRAQLALPKYSTKAWRCHHCDAPTINLESNASAKRTIFV